MRPARVLILLSLLTLSLSLGDSALAQEEGATPGPPAAADCRVPPRTEEEIAALAATPAPEPAPDDSAPVTLPDGDPAAAETIAAITETLREVIACAEAGDLGRLLALLSDDFIVQSVLAPEQIPVIFGTPTGTPVTSPVATPSSAAAGPVVREARLLPDDRVAAAVVTEDATQIVFFVRAGERWLIDEIHPAAAEPSPPSPTTGGAEDQPAAVQPALADAAAQFGVPLAEVTIVSLDPIEWSDSSLGCPEPDRFYAQVITPGYRLRVAAAGQQLEYHTDLDGRFVLCPT